jgi:hypothetical protein
MFGLQESSGLLCCSWSPDGSCIVAGGHDCCAYIWFWDVRRQQQQQQQHVQQQQHGSVAAAAAPVPAAGVGSGPATQQGEQAPETQQQQQQQLAPRNHPQHMLDPAAAAAAAVPAGSNPFDAFRQQLQRDLLQKQQQQQQERRRSRRISSSTGTQPPPPLPQQQSASVRLQHDDAVNSSNNFPMSSTDWPAPIELQRLSGHRNEIVQAEFSSSGAMLATASLDGSVRVSKCVSVWCCLHTLYVACCPYHVNVQPSTYHSS